MCIVLCFVSVSVSVVGENYGTRNDYYLKPRDLLVNSLPS